MATYTITLNERTTSGKAIKKSAMRHLCSKLLLTALISMLCATSFAHDIEVANSDGVKIYYNYNSKLSGLTVTFRGDQCTDYWYEYSGNVVIPESVTHNGNTYIVKGIGKEAFWGCSGLTSVTIPESVTSIGQSAFSSCSSLTSVTIPNGVTSIEQSAFSGCSSLTTVTIPNSVTSISQYAFNNCSGLTSVTIPNSVTTIGERTFYNCSSLTSVTIGNSVTTIGQYAFNGCSSLTSVRISDLAAWCSINFGDVTANPLNYAHHLYMNGKEVKDLIIPEGVTSIADYAFYNCSGLTTVTIPSSVTTIGSSAFYGCSGLTSVNISDLAAWCNVSFSNSDSNPLGYAHHLYLNGEEVTDLIIPESVSSIGQYAFYGCSGLTNLTIPNSVTSIGNRAFMGCSSLTSVIIPNSVTTIGERTFYNCSSLTNVTIPNSVTSIGSAAFYNCSNLTAVKVGMENPVSITSGTFSNRTNAILYVPRGSKEAYEAANYWKEFKEIVEYAPVILLDETSVDDPASYPVTMDVKVQRTIKGGEWNTICLPFAMTGEQAAEALGSVELADFIDYQATKKGDKTISIMINFTPVSAADGMEANHPYLIKTADDIDEFTVSEVMLVPDEENAQTAFTTEEDGQTVSKGYMKGIYHAQTVVPADNLFVSANKFYYSTGKTKMMAYRAYFYLADRLDRNESASAKISFMFNESSTNRIEDVEVRPAASSAIFDIQGRKVADSADGLQGLPKGIYIINGKKVVR